MVVLRPGRAAAWLFTLHGCGCGTRQELVEVYRREVIPMATVLTPNAFEAELLTGVRTTRTRSAPPSIQMGCFALNEHQSKRRRCGPCRRCFGRCASAPRRTPWPRALTCIELASGGPWYILCCCLDPHLVLFAARSNPRSVRGGQRRGSAPAQQRPVPTFDVEPICPNHISPQACER